MNRIRLLSEQVANQIAAGEVVERPSSVVKELVENAIDAKSRRICVEIQAGGRSLIRVTDDGTGMSRDDALLCLERHATSKIQLASDLSSISTMGFRGEALPSIASVSRFSLTTREQGDPNPEATQVIVQGGKVVEVKSVGAPSGTCIEVRQLFFNVPARKKFLRSDETEFAHIQHGLSLAALAHPSVGFTLIRDGKTLWQLPPGKPEGEGASRPFDALSERLRSLLSDDGRHLKVDFQTELPELPMRSTLQDPDAFVDLRTRNLRIWGFIGRPGVSRASRDQHFIFVNRRPVENRGIHYALIEGYHTSLMKGRYPVCCLFLEIDPARVDVNIHPTKREVKFHSEGDIRRLTAEAVRQALLSFHRSAPGMTPAIGFSPSQATPRENPPPAQPAPAAGEVHTDPVVHPVAQAMELPALALDPLLSTTAPTPQVVVPQSRQENPFATRTGSVAAPASAATSSPTPFTPVPPAQNLHSGGPEVRPVFAPTPPLQEMKPVPLLRVPLRIVGVVGRLYVVMESDRGMVLMDQHAAHERVLFE
ncbi:MAG: DNA mismatch repair endonuclease MutL, partial [Verrucomicrobia bacterium]|nr:DNA mismatch repair endonuclease MutL [Verrucomicrobiota bacterium]